jgi:ubiquinone/menaquinone biosynthesis C-methylase UbiE
MAISNNNTRKITKELVQGYWDKHPCDSEKTNCPQGSLGFFEEMEEERYRDQASIHSFAQFTRWHDKKVLEVGFGCGTDLLQFARAGAEMYGVDLSQRSLDLTKQRLELYGLKANVMQVTGESIPFPDNYFDLVYSWGVIHHAPNPPAVVSEIYRVLKPGGRIKAMVYNRRSPVWLKMWFEHAFLKGRIFTSLSRVISEHQESPGTRAYTMKQIKDLFQPFSNLIFEPAPILEISLLNKHRRLSWLVNFYPRCIAAWTTIEGQKAASQEEIARE